MAALVGAALVWISLRALAHADPASLARFLRLAFALMLAASGAAAMLVGRIGLGAALLSAGARAGRR